MELVYVAIGGALGSMGRYLMAMFVGHYTGNSFPYGTLVINITGSTLMGVLIGWLGRTAPEHAREIQLFLAVGILGGYTTFSAFSLDAIKLMEDGKFLAMGAYISASVICSLLGLIAGLHIMRAIA
jgi:CrcB protein